jgi:hypothetical protein
VDTAAVEPEDYWNNYWLFVTDSTDELDPEGEESLVSDFVARTHTFTITPALTAAIGAGDTYEVRRYFSAASIHAAIDHAIEEARQQFPIPSIDETVVIEEDKQDYTLPTTIDYIYKIEALYHNVDHRGTATSGTADTIVDTGKNWTTDDLIGMEVAIYHGTGSGQYRTVESNTATAITVTVDWTTTPDSTSEYVVKDVEGDPPRLIRVVHYDVIGGKVYFACALPEGQRLRIAYEPVHTTLSTDASTTTVPKTYVVLKACQELIAFAKLVAPDAMWAKNAISIHDRLETRLAGYLMANKRPAPYTTILNRGGGKRRRWYSSNGGGIGTRESD